MYRSIRRAVTATPALEYRAAAECDANLSWNSHPVAKLTPKQKCNLISVVIQPKSKRMSERVTAYQEGRFCLIQLTIGQPQRILQRHHLGAQLLTVCVYRRERSISHICN